MTKQNNIISEEWQYKASRMIRKGYKILILFCNGDKFLSYKACKIFYDEQLITEFPNISRVKRYLSRFRLMARLFRMEPRCAEKLDTNRYLVEFKKSIWLVNVQKKSIIKLMTCKDGFSGTLNFCSDDKNVYWGDYGSNYERHDVNVYRVNQDETIDIVHTFKAGTVRHVHNIVWDKSIDRFWIFTGDSDNESAMFHADREWKEIKTVISGSQKYRAVVAFPYQGGIIYATDAVEKQNYLYYLSLKTKKLEQLAELDGSCIYGGENADGYFFSTTVEPTELSAHPRYLYTLGKGIHGWNVKVIRVSKHDNSISEVMKFRKDIWPMRYFKYGCVSFPRGQEQNHDIIIYPVAVRKYDGRNVILELNEN